MPKEKNYDLTLTLIALASLVLVVLLCGCTSFTYTSPKGETCKLTRFGFDTKVGQIKASSSTTTQPATLVIENLDTTAQAIQLGKDAIELAKTLKP